MEKLSERLNIKFTLEIDMDRLGLSERHMITVRFAKKPDEEFLTNLFNEQTYAQDVYMTQGDFDLLIFAASDTPSNYIKWETDIATNLSDYLPELKPSEFVFPQLGYMPLNSGFVDFIREEIKADKNDKLILKSLNENARVSYRNMSESLNINEDTVRYRVFQLMRKGIIRRFTTAIQSANGYLVAYFMRYGFNKYTVSNRFPQMRSHYMNEDEEIPLINSFPLIAPITGSYRSFGMAFHKDKKRALYNAIKWHKILLKSEHLRIAKAVIRLCRIPLSF